MPSSKPRWPYYTVAGLFIAGTIIVAIVFSRHLAKDDAYIAYVAIAVAVVATIVGDLIADRDLRRVVKLSVNAATTFPLITALGVLGVDLIKDGARADVIVSIAALAALAALFPFVAYRYAGDDRITRELKTVQSKLEAAQQELATLRRQRRELAGQVIVALNDAREQRLAREAAEAKLRRAVTASASGWRGSLRRLLRGMQRR